MIIAVTSDRPQRSVPQTSQEVTYENFEPLFGIEWKKISPFKQQPASGSCFMG
jgi:hypothetical protein